jgi:hypothetical protein
MVELGLMPEEFRELLGACAAIRVRDCPASFLQEFLAGRLADASPGLAEKVRRLSPEQMELLRELIKGQQSLLD